MPEPWRNATYGKRMSVDVQSADVDSTLSSFVFLVVISDSEAIAAADMISKRYQIYEEGNATALKYDEINYEEGTYVNACIAVKVTSISSSADTHLWIYYDGDPGSDQDDASNVYDANQFAFLPLNESSGTLYDRTTNNNDATAVGDLPTAVAHLAESYAQDLDGSGDYLNFGSISIPTTGTMSFLFNSDLSDASTWCLWRSIDDSPVRVMDVGYNSPTSNNFVVGWYDSGDDDRTKWNNPTINTGTDYWLDFHWTSGGTSEQLLDGTSKASTPTLTADWDTSTGDDNFLGADGYAGIGKYFNGKVQFLWIDSVVRSTAWRKLRRLNVTQADNSQTWGSEETKPATGNPWIWARQHGARIIGGGEL